MDLRRSINTKIWDDVWFESLTSEEKLIWLYLLTNKNTNMLGIYELSEKKISFEVGLSLETVRKAFESFERDKKAKYVSGFVVLFNWIKNQSYNTNMKKSALADYEKLPQNIKMSVKTVIEFNLKESFGSLSKDYLSLPKIEKESEKESENEDEKHFVVFETFLEEFKKEKPMRRSLIVRVCEEYKVNESQVIDQIKIWAIRNEGKKMTFSHGENSFNLFVKANPFPLPKEPEFKLPPSRTRERNPQ